MNYVNHFMIEIKTNAKELSPEEQYLIRKNIVRMLNKGMKPAEIAQILDVGRSHVYSVKKAYEEKGIVGINPKQRGRKAGEQRKLALG